MVVLASSILKLAHGYFLTSACVLLWFEAVSIHTNILLFCEIDIWKLLQVLCVLLRRWRRFVCVCVHLKSFCVSVDRGCGSAHDTQRKIWGFGNPATKRFAFDILCLQMGARGVNACLSSVALVKTKSKVKNNIFSSEEWEEAVITIKGEPCQWTGFVGPLQVLLSAVEWNVP